jgi:tetratricopeptide (TPR) repeat protein
MWCFNLFHFFRICDRFELFFFSLLQVFAFKAEALLKLHRHEEADTVVSAAQKVETTLRKCRNVPADTTMLLVQSEIDMALGRFEAAVIAAENAAHIDPKNMEVMLKLQKARAVASARTLGNDLYKAGKMLEASVAYSEGLQYDPINAILLCNRAACRSKLGHFEKAVEDCNAALEAQPRYMKALLRRADSNFKMERWDKALKDYESLRKDMPGNVDIAKALFEVQIALKKSRGEETDDMHFGGVVEDVCTNEQLRHAVSLQGMAVVQFNTIWSEQCRQMASFVEQLSKLNPTVNFVKVDVEESPYLAKAENVKFVPTFKIYKNGFKVKELLGPSQQALEIAIGHFSL